METVLEVVEKVKEGEATAVQVVQAATKNTTSARTSKFGHCSISGIYFVNASLGNWCMTMRTEYNELQNGQITYTILYRKPLEEIGFEWKD